MVEFRAIWNALTHYSLATPYDNIDRVKIGSNNGLVPDGTKPLPEPLLNYPQWGSVTITWWQFHKIPQPSIIKISLKITHLNFIEISQGPVS